jgi:ribose-phosphate pyrophosphokinase
MRLIGSFGIQLFALDATRELGAAVAGRLGVELAAHEEREFEDGEHKARPLVSVRDRDVYVLQSLHGGPQQSPHDKLCRLLFFLGALRDAGAARLTAVVPYLAYARKDRRTKSRDPVTTRYVAELFEAVGLDRIVVLDVHNLAAFENAFRCRTEHLEARGLFAAHLAPRLRGRGVTVVSPDAGGAKRAEALRESLAAALGEDVGLAFLEKKRSGGVVSGEAVVGDLVGRSAVIVDDLISTGTTLGRAALACRAAGAERAIAAVTHGLFIGGAEQTLRDSPLETLLVTNSVPPFRVTPETVRARLTVLDVAPLLAEAIRRLHEGGSLVDLMASPAQPSAPAQRRA